MKQLNTLLFCLQLAACSLQLSAQTIGAPIITNTPITARAGGGGTSCPDYDSIGILRTDSATFLIMCCNGVACDTLPVFGSPGGGAVALWRQSGNAIVEVDTNMNVGIGTTAPYGKFNVVDSRYQLIIDSGAFSFFDTIRTGGISWLDSSGNFSAKNFSYINGFNYSANDSTDMSLEIGQRQAGGTHTSMIKLITNAATNLGIIELNVMDTSANAISLNIATTDSVIRLSTTGTGIGINQFAGSAQKLVTALADGTLDTTGMITGFTLDANSNMYAGTGAMAALTTGAQNFVTGIDAGNTITSGNNNVVIGYSAQVADTSESCISIGILATAGDIGSIAMGITASANLDGVAIGNAANATGLESIALGSGASATSTNSVAIGSSATTTAANQLVFGSEDAEMNDIYFGEGVTSTTAEDVAINGTGGAGTNNAASDLILNAPRSTGNATPGELLFQTATVGASGTTLQTLSTAGKFDASTTAGQTRFFLYDVDNGTLERVTVGAADSGGAGFKLLRIPN